MGSKAKELLSRLGLVFLLQCALTAPAVALEDAATPDQTDAPGNQVSEPVMSRGETNEQNQDSMQGINPEDLGVEAQPESLSSPQSMQQSDAQTARTTEAAGAETAAAATAESVASPDGNATTAYTSEAVDHFNRAVEYQHNGMIDRAIKQYKAAIEADGRMAEAYTNLGMLYAEQKDYGKAKTALSKALELKPYRAMTMNALAGVLYSSGHAREAIDQWRQAVTADPHFASAYYNMGLALEEQKSYQEAGNAYSKALSISPAFPELRAHLGLPAYKERPIQMAAAPAQPAQSLHAVTPRRPQVSAGGSIAANYSACASPSVSLAPIDESSFEQYQPVRSSSLLSQAVDRASSVCARDSFNEIAVHTKYEQMPPPAHGVEFSSGSVAFSVSQGMTKNQPKPRAVANVVSASSHNRTTIACKVPSAPAKAMPGKVSRPAPAAPLAIAKDDAAPAAGEDGNVRMFVQPPRTN